MAGLVLKFSIGFKAFATSYLGAYVECLLETGELPSLGANTNSQCDSEKLAFNPDGGGSGQGASANSQSGKDAGANAKSSHGSDGRSAAGGGGGSSSSSSGLSDGFGGKKISAKTGGGSGAADGAGDKDKNGQKFRNVNTTTETVHINGEDKYGYIPLKGYQEEEKTEKNGVLPIKGEVEEKKRARGIPLKTVGRTVASSEEDQGFDFGSLIKYIAIFLIILALVIFFGNQVMQFQKSKE